jgi:hypothetical protein
MYLHAHGSSNSAYSPLNSAGFRVYENWVFADKPTVFPAHAGSLLHNLNAQAGSNIELVTSSDRRGMRVSR